LRLTRFGRGFYSRLTAQLLIRITGRLRHRPEELVTAACCPALARPTEGKTEPASIFHSPVARDYPTRVSAGRFRPPVLLYPKEIFTCVLPALIDWLSAELTGGTVSLTTTLTPQLILASNTYQLSRGIVNPEFSLFVRMVSQTILTEEFFFSLRMVKSHSSNHPALTY
jgi:hypothetical protein